jgi:PST family polysaccharide transporter
VSRIGSVARDSAKTLGGQWTRYLLQIVALVLFSRLLTPADYGIMTMATAVTSVAFVVGDFGLSLAAIQAPTLSDAHRSALFWVNTSLGVVIAGVVLASSHLVGDFYGNDAVGGVVALLSASFVLSGIGVQYRVELTRQGRFGLLAAQDVAAQLIGMIVAFICILCGLQYWSLVWMQLTIALVPLIVMVAAVPWRPGRPRLAEGLRPFMTFGAYTFGTQVINYMSANLDSILLGRASGASALGLYNRAYQFAFTPIQQVASPLTRVFLPSLAEVARDGRALGAQVGRVQVVLTYSLGAVLALLFVEAPVALPWVLGLDWAGAVGLLQVLAVAALLQVCGYPFYWALLALGKTRVLFYAELGPRIVMLIGLVFAAPRGASVVALVVAGGQLLVLLALTVVTVPAMAQQGLIGCLVRPLLVLTAASAVSVAAAPLAASFGPPGHVLALGLVWAAVFAGSLSFAAVRRDVGVVTGVARALTARSRSV